MKKIMIIGCPGSGKSTLAVALHKKTGIPVCHLDMLYWNADKTIVEKSVFLERLAKVLGSDAWIMDGNFSSTMDARMAECDTVIFRDYPTDLCLAGVRERRGKPRPDMPWIETEEDAGFMEFIKGFATQRRPQILALIEKHRGKAVFVFTSRAQADAFLREYK